ncbi:uncharacterized protein LOC130641460 isoform X2 [Hydractinia symbiolongicarpus]|uniref:uncharacterized protein LOC130641460 isoform X2 n=1 Tax=Hydractinia symbiolongicarpus TaxID=13093 RepID=UPI0025506FC8|nr:uncharacterized protein LOC130641460 isoform X2 [Hydractinia symbiolongicarpus]
MWSRLVIIYAISSMVVLLHETYSASICRCENYAYNGKPFVAVWNSPTIGCDFNFSAPIHLKKFGIYENDQQKWDGKRVSVFSSAQLGLYPYFIMNGESSYNGGLPQLVDLNEHLRKARNDIMTKMPDPNYNGLAVIDWEAWRPIWETNWNTKRIYKVRSVELVRSQHPTWTLNKLIEQAKHEFEDAARAMFEHTITLGKELRPKALWGFYGFPDCYANKENRYQCTPEVQKQNEQLEWLFSVSTALYPSMYLLEEHPDNRDYVLGRLRETLRFATKGFGKNRKNIPIFAYHRNIYENFPGAFKFLSKDDLDHTIGAAADIGAAGVVLWGNRYDENTSPEVCQSIDGYVSETLGPYLMNKIKQIESCSNAKCNHRGHCVQKAILTPALLKRYENEQRLSSCAGPTSLLHNGNVIQKKSEVPEAPFTNNTAYTPTAQNISQNYAESGYNIDLGATHGGALVNHSTMDSFFQQLNGTNLNASKVHQENVKHRNNSKTMEAVHHNATHGGGINNHSAVTHHLGIRTENSTRGKIAKLPNVKKSDIPHPLAGKQMLLKKQHNLTMNKKKSMLVHQLLSSVQGSLITTPELLRKHNITNYGGRPNNSKKSRIMRPSSGKVPLMSTKKSRRSWMPHMYVILIGVSLGGAVLFSVIFVSVYYYISLRNTFTTKHGEGQLFTDEEKPSTVQPKAHSSPKGTESTRKGKEPKNIKQRENEARKESTREQKHDEEEEKENKCKKESERSKVKRVNSFKRFKSLERSNTSQEAKPTKTEPPQDVKRSSSRSRSCDKKSRDNSKDRSRGRDARGNSNIPQLKRSNSHRSRSARRARNSDEESEYEVNINELR